MEGELKEEKVNLSLEFYEKTRVFEQNLFGSLKDYTSWLSNFSGDSDEIQYGMIKAYTIAYSFLDTLLDGLLQIDSKDTHNAMVNIYLNNLKRRLAKHTTKGKSE